MKIKSTNLEGAYYFEPDFHPDSRGFFFEWFNKDEFLAQTGHEFNVIQFNYSRSSKGVLRGLHFQLNPMAQSKLVAVCRGVVQDVIVDLRTNSETFGHSYSVELNETLRNQLFVPRGFAHGFLVLSDYAEIMYAVDNAYSREHDTGISYDDDDLNIDWKLNKKEIIVSEKDGKLKKLKDSIIDF